MVIYFCPKCGARYSSKNFESGSSIGGLDAEEIALHILCSCGWEGSLWKNTTDGKRRFVRFAKNRIEYIDDILAFCVSSIKESYIEDRREWVEMHNRLTGKRSHLKHKKDQHITAFDKYLENDG